MAVKAQKCLTQVHKKNRPYCAHYRRNIFSTNLFSAENIFRQEVFFTENTFWGQRYK